MIRRSTAATVILFFAVGARAPAGTINVPGDYPTIQMAIDAAMNGDEILVAPGTYVENIDFTGKTITVRSTGGPALTTIERFSPGEGPAFLQPMALAHDAANNRVLVADMTLDALFTVDLATGDRVIVSDPSTGTGPDFLNAEGVEWDSNAQRGLVLNRVNNAGVFGVNMATGDRTIISDAQNGSGPIMQLVDAMQFDGGQNRVLVTDSFLETLFSINLANGSRTILSSPAVGGGPNMGFAQDVVYHAATNRAYVGDIQLVAIFSIDLATGNRATLGGSGPALLWPNSLALNAAANELIVGDANLDAVMSVDLATGNRAIISDETTGNGPMFSGVADIEFDAANNRVLLIDSSLDALFGIDRATGDRTVLSQDFAGAVVTLSGGEGPGTTLEGFTVTGATRGGGMFLINSPEVTLVDCVFLNNESTQVGGAIRFFSGGNVEAIRCSFIDNSASQAGGAIGMNNSLFTARDCLFVGNSVTGSGGAILAGGALVATNCTFLDNSASLGGAVYTFSGTASASLTNCVFRGNVAGDGGAVGDQNFLGALAVRNSILRDNTPNQVSLITGTVEFCNVAGGVAGTGNIDLDPQFVDPDGPDNVDFTLDDDYHLLDASPCIDAGDNAAPDLPANDIDGEARIQQCRVDMGIDESPIAGTDCNGNGVGDGCDVADGTSLDITGDGVPDECNGFLAYNQSQDTLHASIADAFAAAGSGDLILAPPFTFANEPSIDFAGPPVTLQGTSSVQLPAGGLVVMADDATLAAAAGQPLSIAGTWRVVGPDQANLQAQQVSIATSGLLEILPGGSADIDAPGGVSNGGHVQVRGVLAPAGGITNDPDGTMDVSGFVVGDVANDGLATFRGDSWAVGNYAHSGTTSIEDGSLTVTGTVSGSGSVSGSLSVASAAAGGFGLTVQGDLFLAAGASFLMPSPSLGVQVAGHYDVAIDDNTRYDLAQGTVQLDGGPAAQQNLEAMSLDVGPFTSGLDRLQPGHYPIGTLRVGPGGTTVDLVDNHDNDGQGQAACEAVYADTLIVEAGATLNTLGCPVYYLNLVLNGTVDDPANLIVIEGPPPLCPADFNGDGFVDIQDLLDLLGAWGGNDPTFDIAPAGGDGTIDIQDLLALLGAWGPC